MQIAIIRTIAVQNFTTRGSFRPKQVSGAFRASTNFSLIAGCALKLRGGSRFQVGRLSLAEIEGFLPGSMMDICQAASATAAPVGIEQKTYQPRSRF
ncbi:MAG: hypothetical protein NZ653_05000 [Anaerolineae bacterium]|nr:hypothetical protein [Anaerolineae bacterium]